MQIQLGNPRPRHLVEPLDGAPRVTYIHVPDTFTDAEGTPHYDFDHEADVSEARRHIEAAHSPYLPGDRQGVTRLSDLGHGNQEAYLSVVHPAGHWMAQAAADPTWVWSDNDDFARMLADHYGCSKLDDSGLSGIEETHWTRFGLKNLAPGVVPNAAIDLEATILDAGRLLQSNMMGGGQVGAVGSGTAATATSFTTASTFTTNQWAGYRVYVYSTTGALIVWANVESNTNAAGASVLTVDRWYSAATPGGAAAATPSTPWSFILADGGSTSAWFFGLTANASAAVHTDTSLPSEIATAGGGLVRKIATYANTSMVSPVTWTLTPVYTANGTDVLPVTIAKIGTFVSMIVADATDAMLSETLLSATATLAASGDQLTATDTWTGS